MGERLRPALEEAFGGLGVTIAPELLRGDRVAERAQALAGTVPLVAVGGGDGTLGCAAAALAGSDTVLGILPLGTRNHLARDLGLPLDLAAAAQVIADGRRDAIDLGEVNGRVFVNNASIGLYPTIVRMRDAAQQRSGVPKWVAAVPASLASLRRMRHHRLRLRMEGAREDVVTPLLFVGNNRYSLEAGSVGSREALADGTLSVFAVAHRRRRTLLGFALRTLLGRARDDDFAALGEAASLDVAGSSRAVAVALDGEPVTLRMPLAFRCRAGALTVIVPAA